MQTTINKSLLYLIFLEKFTFIIVRLVIELLIKDYNNDENS